MIKHFCDICTHEIKAFQGLEYQTNLVEIKCNNQPKHDDLTICEVCNACKFKLLNKIDELRKEGIRNAK